MLVRQFHECDSLTDLSVRESHSSIAESLVDPLEPAALACLAILDGVPSTEAVAFVRVHYDPHAVETPGQRRYVARWPGNDDGTGLFADGLA